LGSRAHRHLRCCTSHQRGHTRPAAECRRRAARVAVRALYTLLLRIVVPLVLARLWWRGRAEPLYREAVGERFGHYDGDRPEKLLWIHAVSVGEARAAAPLVSALAGAVADHRILMTCTTAAGRETIKQLYGESVFVAYLPYDLPEAVQRFLEYYRPRLGILMETELWPNLRAQLARPVVLLASTREGEEEPLLAVAQALRALIVVVPRHARRFDEVARWAQSRRTQAPLPGPGDRVHLGDTMGEMAFYYAACDIAVIGGSFAALGGQNLIEALAAGAPVIVGPHMYNFAEATRLALAAGAAVQVRDTGHAMERAAALLADDGARVRMS